jgi:hypothetical protein
MLDIDIVREAPVSWRRAIIAMVLQQAHARRFALERKRSLQSENTS